MNKNQTSKETIKSVMNEKVAIMRPISVEEPKKEIDPIQEIEKQEEALQRCLENLTKKKKLSDHRRTFLDALDRILQSRNAIIENGDDFETRLGCIRFYANSNAYHISDAILSISSREILLDMLDFMECRIQLKIKAIELELIK